MTPEQLSEQLDLVQQCATQLANTAKQLQDANDATIMVDGRCYVPDSLPTAAFAFDDARLAVLEVLWS